MYEESTSIIEDLVETLEDGREGYRLAAEKLADDGHGDLAERMSEFSNERARLSAELRELASTKGIQIEESGSAAAAVHRGWMTMRDTLAGSDPHGVLTVAESGEDHAVSEFERVLDRDDLAPELRQVIANQAEVVRSAHDEVRALRDATAD
jgi:uncharacterized protein (TIGR02284 family)